jgi:lipid-binding SYLF domain-containing protein
MNNTGRIFALLAAALLSFNVHAGAAQNEKIEASIDILEKTTNLPEEEIPPALLRNAQGLAIIPGVIKAGFVVGGSYGKRVLMVRDTQGRWSTPVFLRLAAGSLGWQIGAQSTDVVLVFKTRRSIEGLTRGTFTLGADAAVAAGPVGRRGEASTDVDLKAEILSYSRSRGLFAGVSLEGSKLDVDHNANAEFYGRKVGTDDILEGKVTAPALAGRLLQAVNKATSTK